MTKIEKSLSPQELAAFNARLSAEKGLTLERIRALAAQMGISVSLMGAKRYRDKSFAAYLERLESARRDAEAVAAVAENGHSYSDAAAAAVSQLVFERLISRGEPDDKTVDRYSQIIARLRQGDQRAKELEAKLAVLERKEKERAEALARAEKIAKDSKLSAADREAKFREIFGLPQEEAQMK